MECSSKGQFGKYGIFRWTATYIILLILVLSVGSRSSDIHASEQEHINDDAFVNNTRASFYSAPPKTWMNDTLKKNGPDSGYNNTINTSKSRGSRITSFFLGGSNTSAPDENRDEAWWDTKSQDFINNTFFSHGTKQTKYLRSDGSPGPGYGITRASGYLDPGTGTYHYTALETFDDLPIVNSMSGISLDVNGNPYYGYNQFSISGEDKDSVKDYKLHKNALRALETEDAEGEGGKELSASEAVFRYASIRGFTAHPPEQMVEYPREDYTEKNGKVDIFGSGIAYNTVGASKVYYYNDSRGELMKGWQLDVDGPLTSERVVIAIDSGEIVANDYNIATMNDNFSEGEASVQSKYKPFPFESDYDRKLAKEIYDLDAKNIEPIRKLVEAYNEQKKKNATSSYGSDDNELPLPNLKGITYGSDIRAYSKVASELLSKHENKDTGGDQQQNSYVAKKGLRDLPGTFGDISIQQQPGGTSIQQQLGDTALLQALDQAGQGGTVNENQIFQLLGEGGGPVQGGSVNQNQGSLLLGQGGPLGGQGGPLGGQGGPVGGQGGPLGGQGGPLGGQGGPVGGQGGPLGGQGGPVGGQGGPVGGQDGSVGGQGGPPGGQGGPAGSQGGPTGPTGNGNDSLIGQPGLKITPEQGDTSQYVPVEPGVDALFYTKVVGSPYFDYVYVPNKSRESPYGWLYAKDSGNGKEYITKGNNADVYIAGGGGGGGGIHAKASSGELNKNLNITEMGNSGNSRSDVQAKFVGNPVLVSQPESEENALSAAANAFYTINEYHDILYKYGFDEKSGNFQEKVFGNGGAANDPVVAAIRKPDNENNVAYFRSPPDGSPGRLESAYINYNRDIGLKVDVGYIKAVLVHELTHGLLGRLTGGGNKAGCLRDEESMSYAEAIGDFLGLLWIMNPNEDREAPKQLLKSEIEKYYNDPRIKFRDRRYPYSTSDKVNPSSYSDYCVSGGPTANNNGQQDECIGLHNSGQSLASALYDATWSLVDSDGFGPLTDVNSGKGNVNMMKYLIQAIRTQPCNPSFVDARDAILVAEKMITGGKNNCALWKAFAKRGLGANAKSERGTNNRRTGNFDLPPECSGGK